MSDQRILTRCPSCENQTLTVTVQGHLICTWLDCQQPVVESAIATLKREHAAIREGARHSLQQLTEIGLALDAAVAGGR